MCGAWGWSFRFDGDVAVLVVLEGWEAHGFGS